MTDLWTPTTPPNSGAAPRRKCAHPRAARRSLEDGGSACSRCGADIPAASMRRGRTSRRRGNDIERAVAAQLGLKRTGQYGGPDDARGDWLVAQVKSGASFPERVWRWLQALPADAGQTRAVVLTDAPGPGHRRRAVVVVELEEWVALHGPVPT